MSKRTQRQRPTLLTRICSLLLVLCMTISTNTGIAYATTNTDSTYHKLQNGSFEDYPSFTDAYIQANQTDIPYWNTTAKGGLIELLKENPNTYITGVKVKPSDGLLAAELNADEESTLYQDIKTYPSSVYKWGLDHGARNGTDTMALVIGPTQTNAPSKPDKNGRDQFMQMIDWCIEQNLTSIKTEAGLGEQLTVYSKKFGENGTFVNNAGDNAFSLTPSIIYTEEWHIWIMASSKAGEGVKENPWYSYGDNEEQEDVSDENIGLDTDKYYLYSVPEGQTRTTFAFVSVGVYDSIVTADKQKTYGNFLDNINFEIYYPLSGSTTTHGSAIVSDSGGSIDGVGSSDGYQITVNNELVTYITDGKALKIQAVVKKEDVDNNCEFVGVYCTTRNNDDIPVKTFIQLAENDNWKKTVNNNGDVVYTYYIENVTSPTDLHFIFIKNPTITYDSNGGLPYIVDREYNTTEADNVYSFKPQANGTASEGESGTIFIPPYVSHAATGKNDGWKFTGWLLTGDSTDTSPSEELGTLILPAEHTVACDYTLAHASSESAAQYFKIYKGNPSLVESLQTDETGIDTGVIWEDDGANILYGNNHKGLTMVAQWRWRQAFIPQVDRDGTYVDSTVGGTVDISQASSNAEYYDANYNEDGGKAYYAITNETVTATATAAPGFVFEGWYDDQGHLVTTSSTYSYSEKKESVNTYYAHFSGTIKQTYIREVKNGDVYEATEDDSIAILDRYSYVDSIGKPISATAFPTEAYKFDGWYDADGKAVPESMMSNGMTLSYTTSVNATYYARFSLKEARPANRTISATNYIGVYDGNSHSITVKNANLTGDIIYYSTNGSDWSTTKPTRKNVQNEETVYVKVFNPTYRTETADAYIKITPRPITITVNNAEKYFDTADPEFTGNITEGTLVTKSDLGEISYRRTNTDEAVGTYPDVINANYTENGNYEVTVIPGDFVIKTSSMDGAALVPAGGYKVYDGTPLFASAQVNGAEGYTIYYQVDENGWTTEAPFVTNVSEGEVTVHTKAVKPGYVDLMGEDVTIQILPRPITITVNDAEKNFGTEDPEFIGGITEGTLVSADDIGEITYSRSNNAESVGEYPGVLTAGYTANSNYQVTVVPGKFTIKPLTEAGAILTPTGGEKVYDGEPLYASAQVTGAEGYTIYYKTEISEWSTSPPFVTNVSEGKVTVHTKAVKTGYEDLVGDDVTIQILPRPITITVNNSEKDFDAPDPAFTGSITDGVLVSANDLGDISYYRSNDDEDVGDYPGVLNARYTFNENYTVSVIRGNFTIKTSSTAGANLAPTGGTMVYDSTRLYASAEVTGATGYTIYYKVDSGDWTTEAPYVVNVDEGKVTVHTKAVKPGYVDLTGKDVTIQITPRPITITVNDAWKNHGTKDPTFTGSITSGNLVTDDDLGEITYSRNNADENVGTYTDVITAGYADNHNYEVTVVPGDFTIRANTADGAELIAEGGIKVYDGTPLFANAQVIGAEGYTIYYKAGNGDWSTDAVSVLNVSEGEITVYTKAVKTGYEDLIGNSVTIQITPRPITVTVDDKEKTFGDADPDFTGTITSGTLVEADDLGDIAYYRSGSDEEVGIYSDVLTARYTHNSNYNVTVIPGDFTIKAGSFGDAELVAEGGVQVYNGSPLYASAQVIGAESYTVYFKVEDDDWTTSVPSVTDVDEGEVTVHTKAVRPGYTDLIGNDVTIQILPRPITITANDAKKTFGDVDPVFSGRITSGTLVDENDLGDISYYRTNDDESIGNYTDVITAKYTANSNYEVTVVPGDFSIRSIPSIDANLTAAGGAKVYDGTPLYASAQVIGGEGYTIYFKTGDGKWSTEVPFVTNVSEGEVTVHTKAVKAGYDDLIGNDVTIQITPRPVTITVNNAEKDEGEEDPSFTGSITRGSLVDEDDLGEIAYYRVSDDEEAGTYPDVLTARYTHNGNYTVDIIRGDFTINAGSVSKVTLIATGGIKVYDGTPLYARATVIGGEGYTVYFKAGNGDWTTEVPSVTDVADGEVIVQTKAVKDGSEDVFGANVTIQITPRPITITVNDSEKNFGDTDPDFSGAITSGSLVNNDDLGDITYYRTNDDEDVGTYREVLDADYTRNSNYEVSVITGDFIINDNTVIVEGTLIAEGGAKVYDGTPLYASARVVGTDGYTIYYKVNNGDWTTDASSVLNVSDGKVTVHTKAVKAGYNDLLGNDVTIQITPRSVILTSATDSKPYDETPLTNHQVTVSGDGFIENEGADYTVTGSQTEIGSSNNTFTYELYANTDASNYNITVKEGTLTVTSVQTPDEPEEPDEPDKPSKQPKPSKPARPEKPAQPENPNPPTLTKDHVAYIIGYVDGTVRPNNLITRAEVTTIFFRLLSDESRSEFWNQTNPYSDVSRNLWCNNAISTLTNAGIILGYNDGTFKPDAPITRAQLAAIAVRFSTVIYDGDSTFNDVPSSHWASRYIALAEYLGWINGYRDNTFKPDQYITRAEAITLINRVLERDVEEEYMLPGMITWIDNPPYTWCYEAIQEATNSHDYTRTDKQSPEHDFNYEAWLRINPVPNWAGLEREWSTANSK